MEERRFSAALREQNVGLQPPWNIPSLDACVGADAFVRPRDGKAERVKAGLCLSNFPDSEFINVRSDLLVEYFI